MDRYAAEGIGTYALVFTGTGAIIVNELMGGIPLFGIAAIFGLIVMTMIFAVGDVSGAHFNPAVTIGFWLARRFSGAEVLPYLMSQIAGALAASLTLHALFKTSGTLGSTQPTGSVIQSFTLEIIITSLLMFTILSVTTGAREKSLTPGFAIGGVVALGALFAGPISGASMNPARSLAPAIVSGMIDHLWIYMTAPTLGAAAGVLACRSTRGPECCGGAEAPPSSQTRCQ